MQEVDFPDISMINSISSRVGMRRMFDALRESILENDGNIHSFRTVLTNPKVMGKGNGFRYPLWGVPFSVKDIIDTAGIETAYGSELFSGHIPLRNASIVESLIDKGAILQGKTETHEFAMGIVTPQCRNPWDLKCITGGSSGGSAAAVAALFSPFSIGTDTAGSIRIPAAMCGVTGLKVSSNSLPLDGIYPESPSLDNTGVLTRKSSEIPFILECMGFRKEQRKLGEHITGIMIRELFEHSLPEVRKAVTSILEKAASEGILELAEESFPELEEISRYDDIIDSSENYLIHRELFSEHRNGYSRLSAMQLENSMRIPAYDYIEAEFSRKKWKRKISGKLKNGRVLLSPTIPEPAPPYEQIADSDPQYFMKFMSHTNLFNFSGNPAITIPSGFLMNLPVGLQIASSIYTDSDLCNLASLFQNVTDFHRKTPDWCYKSYRKNVEPLLAS